jgi:FkbM family methyltransferase
MKQLIKRVLSSIGYRVQSTRYVPRQLLEQDGLLPIEFDDVVCRRMFEFGEEFTFVQVGAFDGVVQDPLRKYITKYGWRGVLVEPQARAASRLHELYQGSDRVVVLQAAVDGEAGKRTLFTVDSQSAPPWAGALASFQRDTILKHSNLIPGLEAMIREEIVNCIRFDYVLEHLPPGRLDILQIDTEGADAYLLSIFPFEKVRPAIIHWEVAHLNKEEREECLGRLATFGYRFAPSGDQDMMAVQF